MLRKALVGAPTTSWSFRLGLGPPASRREDSLPRRQERKERAAVAVARARGAFAQFVGSAEVYEPLRNTQRFGGQAAKEAKPSSEAKEEEVMIPTQRS